MNEELAHLIADEMAFDDPEKTGTQKLERMERYYESGEWKSDGLTAEDLAGDLGKIVQILRSAIH